MARVSLSQDELVRFRHAVCEVATRRFAENGYAGVTMRAIAAELGCSPMTPYRYFENKAEIFDEVRRAAFERFAHAQQAAADLHESPIEQLRELGRAYCRFAVDEPQAYRIMFELDPAEAQPLGGDARTSRAWEVMRSTVGRATADGALRGDPAVLAHLFWCGVHGLVTLHLSGKLTLGKRLEDLIEPFLDATLASAIREPKAPPEPAR